MSWPEFFRKVVLKIAIGELIVWLLLVATRQLLVFQTWHYYAFMAFVALAAQQFMVSKKIGCPKGIIFFLGFLATPIAWHFALYWADVWTHNPMASSMIEGIPSFLWYFPLQAAVLTIVYLIIDTAVENFFDRRNQNRGVRRAQSV